MKIAHAKNAATILLFGFAAGSAQAASYNLNLILANPGFESGLTSWGYSGQAVNATNWLTDGGQTCPSGSGTSNEWGTQTWSCSSPYTSYSDAVLAADYPGKPWGANPNITHIDQSTVAGDPTTVIAAAVGAGFVGSRQDGYEGHCLTGGGTAACGTLFAGTTAFYDTNFQIYQAIVGTYNVGDTFDLTVWGNRGRLNQDWSGANGTSNISAAVCSQANLTLPCASGTVQSFNGIGGIWGADGQWVSYTFHWTLGAAAASHDIRVQLSGLNSDHDRYVAIDLGAAVVPVPAAVWMFGSALGMLGWIRRRVVS